LLLTILIPVLAVILLAGGGVAFYALKYRPWHKRDAMQSLEQALIGDSFLFDEQEASNTAMWSREIKLDLQSLAVLPDRPPELAYQTFFQSFDDRLPYEFIEGGNP